MITSSMNFEIKIIEKKQQWEKFVDDFAPHTFLQTWQWKLSQEIMGSKTFALGIFKREVLVGVAFVYKIKARRGSYLFCPHGPLIEKDFEAAFEEFFGYLKKLAKKEKVDFIRICPLEIETEEKNIFFKKMGFIGSPMHSHPELSWMLNLEPEEKILLSNMKKRTRYSITKAVKDGVEVVISDSIENIDEFYDVYTETAKRQIFVPFSKDYIKKEFEIFSKENKILLFFAKCKGEIIATAMVIYSNGSGYYHHGASTRKHSSIPASEFLQWNAILEAKKRGMKLYNFWGISDDDNPNHPWTGITRFKKGFGGFDERYVHSQDYPVTLKYWLNYCIETLRRIKRKY